MLQGLFALGILGIVIYLGVNLWFDIPESRLYIVIIASLPLVLLVGVVIYGAFIYILDKLGMRSKSTAPLSPSPFTDVDPLEEANVYLSHGRREQAIAILEEAARENPERKDIRKRLTEVKAGTPTKTGIGSAQGSRK